MRRHKDISWIHVRHEETASFAAGAEAHLTGKLTVCAGKLRSRKFTSDQRTIRLLSQQGTGTRDRRPHPHARNWQQLFSGDPSRTPFQGVQPLLRTCFRPRSDSPDTRNSDEDSDFRKRGFRCGSPGDIALKDSSSSRPLPQIEISKPVVLPSSEEVSKAAGALNKGSKVTILAGAGSAAAHAELMEAARLLQAPIVHTIAGKEFVEYR